MSDSVPHAQTERRIHRVGALLEGLGRLLEDQVGRLWVLGEISNLHRAGSGHVYFSLKDEVGQLRAVMFRSAARRIPFDLEEGAEVVVYGDVSIYAQRGDLQLIIRHVEPRGQGALQLAFEQLRRRLEAEGLFEASRKRELPPFPRRIGIVSSATGAALHDVLRVARERFPATPLLLAPTRVQGPGSEREIALALDQVAVSPDRDDVDVVLLVRGGGSLEDLWSFNTEQVARAIERCPVPVVSGVGHEVDVTIADLVADARAPTPSAAAALVLPDRRELRANLARDRTRLLRAIRETLRQARQRLAHERNALRVLAPTARLAAQRARLVQASRALSRELRRALEIRRQRIAVLAGRLDSLSPLSVLARGFAMVRRESDGRIVRDAAEVSAGDRVLVQVAEGRFAARVDGTPADGPREDET